MKESRWDQFWNSLDHVSPLSIGAGTFLVCWCTFIAYYEVKFGLDVPPATSGDEVDYDSMGWELSQGRGFTLNTADEEFRRPYDNAAQRSDLYRLVPQPAWKVTYRPPLFPLAISGWNRLFGRQFWGTRLMDAAFMAGTLAFIAMTVYRWQGWLSVLVCVGLFVVVDYRTRLYGRAILTEAISLFLVSLLCVALLRLSRSKAYPRKQVFVQSLLLGGLFGVTLMARSMMILWVPGLLLLVGGILWGHRRSYGEIVTSSGLFLLGCVMVFAPWGIRNIQVTGEWMPLGTQGQVQLSAAFSDFIWEDGGAWRNLEQEGFFEAVIDPSQTRLEREIAMAKYSKTQAMRWIRENPIKTIVLAPLKVWQECRPRGKAEGLILFLMSLGLWRASRTGEGKILLFIVLINLSSVAATWSVGGRFLVPILYPIHIFAASGGEWLIRRVLTLRFFCRGQSVQKTHL